MNEYSKIPIILCTYDEAVEMGIEDKFSKSLLTNIECCNYLCEKVADRKKTVLTLLIDKYGTDRVKMILAIAVLSGEKAKELSVANKKWARNVMLPEENTSEYEFTDYTSLDILVTQFRQLETSIIESEKKEQSTNKNIGCADGNKKPLAQRITEIKENTSYEEDG